MNFLLEPTLPVALIELVVGLLLLTFAADKFVDGAVGIARVARISPVAVGAVIVGFGTSAPELLVSGIAASNGDLDLGVGNVVGSNVANLTLVLGAAAFIIPVLALRPLLVKEVPISLGSTLLFAFFTIGGFAIWEGLVMLGVLVAMLIWTMNGARDSGVQADTGQTDSDDTEDEDDDSSLLVNAVITLVGLAGTVLGAQFLVTGATTVADEYGLTGGFVGFTLVALGTSLPELVTAIAAARKSQTDLIMGNLLGSNMFNSLAVGGVIAILGPGLIDDESIRTVGIIAMVFISSLASIFIVTRRRLHRVEAIILLGAWLGTVVLLAQGASS